MTENILNSCTFRVLLESDIPIIAAAFTEIGWNKPLSLFQQYFGERQHGERVVWVAFMGNVFLGYVTLKWHSAYQPFALQKIPEVNDLNVLPAFRRQGVGSKLLDLAEVEAQKRSSYIGIGVGLYADYGDAQKLYVKRGYVPDGCGVTYKNKLAQPWSIVRLDDDLVLWLVKKV